MTFQLFTIHDSKADAFLQPFFFEKSAQALRAITDLANDPEHMFCKHASDYTLFHIAQFDNQTAEIIPQDKYAIANLLELRKDPEKTPLFSQETKT